MSNIRQVMAGHGFNRGMAYRYRARIEEKKIKKFLFFGEIVSLYRYVIERQHGSAWEDDNEYSVFNSWGTDKNKVIQNANNVLDKIEAVPEGEYVKYVTN